MDAQTPTRPTLHLGALFSFALGLASFFLCMLGVSGLPALLLGYHSLRAVNSSGGRRSGAWLATGGMALGGLGTLATLAGLLALAAVELQIRGRRVACQDNLRRVGFSLKEYEGGRGTFPPAVVGPRGVPPEHQIAWTYEVVPSLGAADPKGKARIDAQLAEAMRLVDPTKPWDDDANAKAASSPVRFLACPAGDGVPGRTNYVGVSGVGPDAASLRREDDRAGLFGYDRGVKLAEAQAGISHVMSCLETNEGLGPWLAGGPATARGLSPEAESYVGRDRPFGGLHPGMANVLWADGSVRPVSEGAAADVLRRQATLRGGR